MAAFRNHRRADAIRMLILVLGLCTAAGAGEFAGGTGEIDDPYQIATAEQLVTLGSDPNLYDRHFVLVADIDLDPNLPGGRVFDRAVIAPTASDVAFSGLAFSGSLDGAMHTISNLTIVVQSQSLYITHLGLFGCVAAEGKVSRLRVTNARINQPLGLRSSGLLCGENRGIIRDCHVSGDISYSNYTRGVGGVAGVNDGFMYRSTAEADLSFGNPAAVKKSGLVALDANSMVPMRGGGTGNYAAAPQSLGALVGSNSGIIADCHATGSVTGSSYSSSMGGIAGANGNEAMVVRCYCVLREGSARRCVGGGVEGAVANSYYLRDPMIPDPGPRYGIGLTDAEMRQQANFAGWDFAGRADDGTADTWVLPPGGGYPVLAAERPFDLAGQGTEADPFLVGSVLDLGLIVQRPEAFYRLTADIDCAGIVWAALLAPWFAGTLDGAGYTVSHVELSTTGSGGLLGRALKNSTIRNLHLNDVEISGSQDSSYVGALACVNAGAIVNCSATGRISGNDYVGGLIGKNDGAVCSCLADVTVAGVGPAYRVGGLIGVNGEGIVVGCHAGGLVTASQSSQYVGGLIGIHGISVTEDIDGVSVINCCSTGAVVGGKYVGGLIGSSSRRVLNCHAAGSVEGAVGSHGAMDVGGLIGVHTGGTIAGSYFLDPNDGGGPNNGVGERLSARQMAEMESFPGWDFAERSSDGIANLWSLPEGASYPLPSGLDRALPGLEGRGTAQSPYLIRSGADIHALSQNPTAHFRLDADIDLEGIGHGGAPIPLFAGHLEGAGHRISGLSVTCSGYGGLFGVIHDRAAVSDLHVVDANVVGLENEPLIGILAGLNRGSLAGCHVQGNVRGNRYTGGLAGVHTGSAAMIRCQADVTISTSDGIWVGGLVGGCRDAMLSECSAVATILGEDYLQATGGLAGDVSFGTVARCFALGQIQGGKGTWHLGGLVGNLTYGQILDCYAGVDIAAGAGAHRVGGLLGDAFGEGVRNCYSRGRVAVGEESAEVGGFSGFGAISGGNLWDRQTSGLDWSFGGTGLTPDQMKRAGTFINLGWDFAGETANGTADVWTICEGKDYPRLAWEQVACE